MQPTWWWRDLAYIVARRATVIVVEFSVGVSFDVEAGFVIVRFAAVVVAIGGHVTVEPVGHPV